MKKRRPIRAAFFFAPQQDMTIVMVHVDGGPVETLKAP